MVLAFSQLSLLTTYATDNETGRRMAPAKLAALVETG
jgi:hypothetical protein